jgi:hypothetical protein
MPEQPWMLVINEWVSCDVDLLLAATRVLLPPSCPEHGHVLPSTQSACFAKLVMSWHLGPVNLQQALSTGTPDLSHGLI